MNKQAVLDVLNSLEVVESHFEIDEAWILVESSEENFAVIESVEVSRDTALAYGDEQYFCILALAFSEEYANGMDGSGKLVYRLEGEV